MKKLLLISVIITIITYLFHVNNDYMTFKNTECVVLDKMTTTGGRKSSGKFYLVLKDNKGEVFDLIVAPSTFYQAKEGKKIVFNLRPMDIKQTPMENTIFFFGEAVLMSICLAFWIVSFIYLIYFLHNNLHNSK